MGSNKLAGAVSFLVDHYQIFLIFPILLAFAVEKHYIGRASVLSNTVSMFAAIAPAWDSTRWVLNYYGISFFHAYLLIGLGVGLICFLGYIFGSSYNSDFYWFLWIFYNSVVAGILCLLAAIYL